MHNFLKYLIVITIMATGSRHMYGAKPADKGALATTIHNNLRNIHTVLAQLVALPNKQLVDELTGYDQPSLVSLSAQTAAFLSNLTCIKSEINPALFEPAHLVPAHKPMAAQLASVPATASQIKTTHEPKKSLQSQPPSEAKVAADAFAGMGTNTMKFMHKNPSYMRATKIANAAKVLAELTTDDKKLDAFRPLNRSVTGIETGLLGIFSNSSQGKLEKFVEYLKALISGTKIKFYRTKFHVTSVCGNVHEAAVEMAEEEGEQLYKLLHTITLGIK